MQYIKANKFKIATILILVALFFYLEYVYINFIAKIYAYEGYFYDFNFSRSLLARFYIILTMAILLVFPVSPFIYSISVLIKIFFSNAKSGAF